MATDLLVGTLAEDGLAIVSRLESEGFLIQGAFWVRTEDLSPWYLYLITDTLETQGLGESYRRLFQSLAGIPDCPVPLADVKLIGDKEPMALQVLRLTERYPGRDSIQLADVQVGDRFVEHMYIYTPSALWGGPRLGFTVTYRRQGESDVWEARVKQDDHPSRMRPKGAVTYTTARWGGQTKQDDTFALVSVLVELSPELDNPSILASEAVRKLLANQAKQLADPMFLQHHPGAVIAPA